MDKEMRERIGDEKQEIRQQEMEHLRKRQEEYERDPTGVVRKMIISLILLAIFVCGVFLAFRAIEVCTTPRLFCDTRFGGEYGKKCYPCTIRGILHLDTLEDGGFFRSVLKSECQDKIDECIERQRKDTSIICSTDCSFYDDQNNEDISISENLDS